MNDAVGVMAERSAIEVRAGVLRPDWSVVTSTVAADALRARDGQRSFLLELWAIPLDQTEDLVWRRVVGLFAALGRAPRVDEIAIASGVDVETLPDVLGKLEKRDLLGLCGNDDEIINAYPFTARATDHVVELGAHKLNALCAVDALGVGAMCGRDVMIKSRCRTCGTDIQITTADQGKELGLLSPAGTVVWLDGSYSDSAAVSCCPRIAFFCSDEHLNAWLRVQDSLSGRRLSAEEALQVGRAIFGPVLVEPAASRKRD